MQAPGCMSAACDAQQISGAAKWFTQLTTMSQPRKLMVDTTVNQPLRVGDVMHGLNNRSRVAAARGARGRDGRGGPDGPRRAWSLLGLLSVAQVMVILDATWVDVALPSIARSLTLRAGGLQRGG